MANCAASETFIEKAVNVHGKRYDYTKVVYTSVKQPVTITCDLHGDFYQTPDSHLHKKSGCPECAKNRRIFSNKNRTVLYEDFLARAREKHGNLYLYKEKTFTSLSNKIEIVCPIHGSFLQRASNHLLGRGCPSCAHNFVGNFNSISGDSFVSRAKTVHGNKYMYVPDLYNKSHLKTEIQCPLHGSFLQRPNNHLMGQGCPKCSAFSSSLEVDIYDVLRTKGLNVERNNRGLITPQEVDLFIPEHNLAIEICGLYWHSENQGKTRNYHLDKYTKCRNKGIRLITVFEDEWVEKKNIVTSTLLSKLGKFENRIFARNCIVRRAEPGEFKDFSNLNHLQGYDRSSTNYIIQHEGENLGGASFKKSRFSKNIQWELTRLCFKQNTQVIGGFGKLFSHFIREYEPESIVAYADLRYGEGNVYSSVGFNLHHTSPPNYWYFKEGSKKRESRVKYQKHKITNGKTDLTEAEIMKNRGYNRIFDCGNNVWVWLK